MIATKSNTATPHRMVSIPTKCDPVPRADKDGTSFNPNINNRGGSLYNQEAFSIVRTHETEKERQERENKEEYGYEATDVELAIQNECRFDTYKENSWEAYDWDERIVLQDPVRVQYGDNPDEFYMDTGETCHFRPTGGSFRSDEINASDELLLTDEQLNRGLPDLSIEANLFSSAPNAANAFQAAAAAPPPTTSLGPDFKKDPAPAPWETPPPAMALQTPA